MSKILVRIPFTLLLLSAPMALRAGPTYDLDTTVSSATLKVSGVVKIAASSATANTSVITLDGANSLITAPAATLSGLLTLNGAPWIKLNNGGGFYTGLQTFLSAPIAGIQLYDRTTYGNTVGIKMGGTYGPVIYGGGATTPLLGLNNNAPKVALDVIGGMVASSSITAGAGFYGAATGLTGVGMLGTSLYLGTGAGNGNASNYNTMLGYTAGYNSTTGSGNTFLGSGAGYHNSAGDGNIFIGYTADYPTDISNYLCIGNGSGCLIRGVLNGSSVTVNGNFYASTLNGSGSGITGVATSTQLTSTAAALTSEISRATAREDAIAVSTGAEVAARIAADLTLIPSTATGNYLITVSSATALKANPTDCGAGEYATSIDAQGNLTCGTPSGAGDVLKSSTQTLTGQNYFNNTVSVGTTTNSATLDVHLVPGNAYALQVSSNNGVAMFQVGNAGDITAGVATSTVTVPGWIDIGISQVVTDCNPANSCSATCPAGKKVISGGCRFGSLTGVNLQSYPATDNTYWTCYNGTSTNMSAIANCARIK